MTAPIALLVFVSALALDFAYARYYLAVQARAAHRAARWSLTIYVAGLVGFVAVVDDSLWYALPEAAGLYVGTWLAVWRAPSSERASGQEHS